MRKIFELAKSCTPPISKFYYYHNVKWYTRYKSLSNNDILKVIRGVLPVTMQSEVDERE